MPEKEKRTQSASFPCAHCRLFTFLTQSRAFFDCTICCPWRHYGSLPMWFWHPSSCAHARMCVRVFYLGDGWCRSIPAFSHSLASLSSYSASSSPVDVFCVLLLLLLLLLLLCTLTDFPSISTVKFWNSFSFDWPSFLWTFTIAFCAITSFFHSHDYLVLA